MRMNCCWDPTQNHFRNFWAPLKATFWHSGNTAVVMQRKNIFQPGFDLGGPSALLVFVRALWTCFTRFVNKCFGFPQFDYHGLLETISSAFSIVFHPFVRFKATVTVNFLLWTIKDGEHPVHELSSNGQCHGHAPTLAMLAMWTR